MAGTALNTNVTGGSFNTVYREGTTFHWNYTDKEHNTSLDGCTPGTKTIYLPGDPPVAKEIPEPYPNAGEHIADVNQSVSPKQYTYFWDGHYGNTPAALGTHTFCAIPMDEYREYFGQVDLTVANPNPAAPAYLNVEVKPTRAERMQDSNLIRGIAERGTRVTVTITYTKREGNDQFRSYETVTLPPVDVPFDNKPAGDLSHLDWAGTWAANHPNEPTLDQVITNFPKRDDNTPSQYLRQWSIPYTLKEVEIADISATAERLPDNPYYNPSDASKNKSGVSKAIRVLRYKAPTWDVTWQALAGYYYRASSAQELKEKVEKIAGDNREAIPSCNDTQGCPAFIDKGLNFILQDPELAGKITIRELQDLSFEQIANRKAYSLPAWWDPINLATGDFSFHHTNLTLQAMMPLEFKVAYHSRHNYDGSLGVGWHHSWEWHLERSEGEVMSVITPEGGRYTYVPTENGQYRAPAGGFDQLIKQSDGTFLLTTPQQLRYLFRQDGLLSSLTDAKWKPDYTHV